MEERYDTQEIKESIHTKWAGSTVHFAAETDSTNLWAQRLADEGAPHGTLCVAGYQSAGRGSRARSWSSPPDTSVMMSLLLRPELRPDRASMLTLVMGLAVADTVDRLGLSVSIKWPNDVVVSRKKICGILTEMALEGDRIRDIVVGVGLNVNVPDFPEELADKATSLMMEAGHTFSRAPLIGMVMEAFEGYYDVFMRTGDLSGIRADYERHLANRDAPVRILDGQDTEGIALGIDERGRLLVRCGGELRRVNAGEVSVRGLYSYV